MFDCAKCIAKIARRATDIRTRDARGIYPGASMQNLHLNKIANRDLIK